MLPLEGITVLELGSSLAGPYGCRILADMGAEVIKVEPPQGDQSRAWGNDNLGGTSSSYQMINKDKRSIVADIKNPDELGKLKALIAGRVDIVVQNLRPGVAEKAGLGGEEVLELNPRVIYCNIAAYGRSGPLRELPGYDPLLQAFSGIVDVTGPADGDPARVGVPIIDIGTGLWATIGILGALQGRNQSGKGCIVDASMMETALVWQTINHTVAEAGGKPATRSGFKGPLLVPNTAYHTSDGLLFITVGTDSQYKRLCQALGSEDLLNDPRFSTSSGRAEHEDAFNEAMGQILGQQPRAYWSERLNEVDVPNAPCNSLSDAIAHPQVEASGLLQKSPGGDFEIMGVPLKFNGERPAFRKLAPALGEATSELLN